MKNNIGINLASLRNQTGLSQEALAEKLNISRQAISNWERSISEPDIETITRIAEILNVPITNIINEPLMGKTSSQQKSTSYLFLFSVVFSFVHLVLGFLGYVNIVAVITLPVLCAFSSVIMNVAFSAMIKTNNYSLLAGFDKKKDNIQTTQLRMYWIKLLSDINAIIFNVLFVTIYFADATKQMNITVLMFFVYISIEAMCVVITNIKIK